MGMAKLPLFFGEIREQRDALLALVEEVFNASIEYPPPSFDWDSWANRATAAIAKAKEESP